ncbi:MAG: hypothetical protein Q4F41_14345 [Eubacteriales bacterium]|nr:hypothetical protein [Eubacteriales bacterium]
MEKSGACRVLFCSGEFIFELQRDWAKWPADMENRAVSGIAEHPDGCLYVSTRSVKYPICVFDRDGTCIRTFGAELNFARTHGLTVDLEGNLWICDDPNCVVYHLDAQGKVLGMLGEKGVASDSGYDPSVRWPHDLYTNKQAAAPFNRPTRMVQAPWGDLYCTDGYGNTAVHRFTAEGTLLRTWGGPGREPGKFRLPHSIAIDSKERLWICDRENFLVQIYDKEGTYLTRIEDVGYPSEVCGFGAQMYLCDGDGCVRILDLDGRQIGEIGYPGCFGNIHSIGADRDGNLYLGRIDNGEDSLFQLKRCDDFKQKERKNA